MLDNVFFKMWANCSLLLPPITHHLKLVAARLKFKRGEEDCRDRAQEA